jgi:acyl carrier protein
MSDLSISGRVNAIIVAVLGVPPNDVLPGAWLISDLGADQLDLADIIMQLEDEFDVDLPWLYGINGEFVDDVSVGDLVEAVERLVRER